MRGTTNAELNMEDLSAPFRSLSTFDGHFATFTTTEGYGWDSIGQSQSTECCVNKISDYAIERIKSLVASEPFQALHEASQRIEPIPRLEHAQVEIGRLVGEGGFAAVYKLKKCSVDKIDARSRGKLVVKMIKRDVFAHPDRITACALGLAQEAEILSLLDHPHIIKLRACSAIGLPGYTSGRNDGFFLVFDRLNEMLSDRLNLWRHRAALSKLHIISRGRVRDPRFRERLVVATQLADAMSYLHQHGILHRDLKPANVGFDSQGSLILFDFDCCRILPADAHPDKTFKLTKSVGTLRYMSPECALTCEYNLKSDCYSFAILFHKLLSLQKPYRNVPREALLNFVIKKNLRPIIPDTWPTWIKDDLLPALWASDIRRRPTMKEVHALLVRELKTMPKTTALEAMTWSLNRKTLAAV
jgi:serine/threonine protein kinase